MVFWGVGILFVQKCSLKACNFCVRVIIKLPLALGMPTNALARGQARSLGWNARPHSSSPTPQRCSVADNPLLLAPFAFCTCIQEFTWPPEEQSSPGCKRSPAKPALNYWHWKNARPKSAWKIGNSIRKMYLIRKRFWNLKVNWIEFSPHKPLCTEINLKYRVNDFNWNIVRQKYDFLLTFGCLGNHERRLDQIGFLMLLFWLRDPLSIFVDGSKEFVW